MSSRTRLLIVAPLLAGLIVAPAAYAQQHYNYHGAYRGGGSGHHDNAGDAITGGIISLGLGAAGLTLALPAGALAAVSGARLCSPFVTLIFRRA